MTWSPRAVISGWISNRDQSRKASQAADQAQRLEASVIGYTDENVAIRVHTPGQDLEISLPADLVPIASRAIGAPIYVTLQRKDGIRHPLVEPREVPGAPDEKSGAAWAETVKI